MAELQFLYYYLSVVSIWLAAVVFIVSMLASVVMGCSFGLASGRHNCTWNLINQSLLVAIAFKKKLPILQT